LFGHAGRDLLVTGRRGEFDQPDWLIAGLLLHRDVRRLQGNAHHFRKTFPFVAYGREFGDFEHIYFCDRDLSTGLLARIDAAFVRVFGGDGLTPVSLVDRDPNLKKSEARSFHIAEVTTTIRSTRVTVALHTEMHGHMQSLRWWLLLGGFVDSNKRLVFLAMSPVTLPFLLLPYMLGKVNFVDRVRTIYGSAYNDHDILTLVRGGHQAVFDALVEVLEENDIDTSDLKTQRAQVMNISISGGKVNMGNVVQGAMNRVSAKVGVKTA
jgi:hypothetical protein